MKFFVWFAVFLLILVSCEDDIDHPIANTTWPVVHCLLDADDTIHYVRLGKTFSGPDFSSMVNNPDSLYYRDARVWFDLINTSGERLLTVELNAVDSLKREPGLFPATPFLLYSTNQRISKGSVILRAEIPGEQRYIRATIMVRGKPAFFCPDTTLVPRILDFYEARHVTIAWDGYPGVSETITRLWYLEQTRDEIFKKHLDWTRDHADFVLYPDQWFDFLLYHLGNNDRVVARKILSVDLIASGGNAQWANYLFSKDFTYDLVVRPYSNISGGIGFVGSRSSGGTYGYILDKDFLDSLCYLERLEVLKFVQ